MTVTRLRSVSRWACECMRCGHKWVSIGHAAPPKCAKCRRRNWNVKPGVLKRGRPIREKARKALPKGAK